MLNINHVCEAKNAKERSLTNNRTQIIRWRTGMINSLGGYLNIKDSGKIVGCGNEQIILTIIQWIYNLKMIEAIIDI